MNDHPAFPYCHSNEPPKLPPQRLPAIVFPVESVDAKINLAEVDRKQLPTPIDEKILNKKGYLQNWPRTPGVGSETDMTRYLTELHIAAHMLNPYRGLQNLPIADAEVSALEDHFQKWDSRQWSAGDATSAIIGLRGKLRCDMEWAVCSLRAAITRFAFRPEGMCRGR